jgi:hypothetical protein
MSVRWRGPSPDLMSTARAMDRLFDQFFGNESRQPERGGTQTYVLPVDIIETEDAYQLYATVAGRREALARGMTDGASTACDQYSHQLTRAAEAYRS